MTFLATKYFTQQTSSNTRLGIYNPRIDDDDYDDDDDDDYDDNNEIVNINKINSIKSKKATICKIKLKNNSVLQTPPTPKIIKSTTSTTTIETIPLINNLFDCMLKFEDLQGASIALRKALNDIKFNKNTNKINIDEELAFDNLTYLSSNDEIPTKTCKKLKKSTQTNQQQKQQQQQNEALKKTLKSIKRKDKLKKTLPNNSQSIEITKRDETKVTSREFEKRIRKKYRSKSLARSLRRAKTVFYRNQRSKSLEDLSCTFEELKTNLDKINNDNSEAVLSRVASVASISSCSSFTSGGIPSDISSSYFHELSDCELNLSDSDSILSDSISLDDVNWDETLPDLPMSEYCTSSSDENESNDEQECDCENCKPKEIKFQSQKNSTDSLTHDLLENMLSMVMNRMFSLHPHMYQEAIQLNMPATKDLIANLRTSNVTQAFINENKSNPCPICLTSFELNDEITSMPSCTHPTHFICAKIWLTKSSTCPVCCYSYTNSNSINNRETLL